MASNVLQYLKLDYASQKDALIQRIKNRWPRAWNDFTGNNFGMLLVDLIAWSTATLAFVANRIASENYIPTMRLRESAVRLGALVGYKLRGPAPSLVQCEAVLASARTDTVSIPALSLVRASTGSQQITFEVSQQYLITPGNLTPISPVGQISPSAGGSSDIPSNLAVVSGQPYADLLETNVDLTAYYEIGQTFQQTGVNSPPENQTYKIISIVPAPGAISNNRFVLDSPWAGVTNVITGQIYDTRIQLIQGQTVSDTTTVPSTGNISFTYMLSRQEVLEDSVSVAVNSIIWTAVGNLALSQPTDTVYEVRTLSSGDTIILFGDGNFGEAVPTEAQIIVNYRVGGGSAGNVATNTVTANVTGTGAAGAPVIVSLTNQYSIGEGGADAETLEQARSNIPAYASSQGRAVTLQDYQVLAQSYDSPSYGRVQFARASATNASLLEGNVVTVVAWATGPNGTLLPLSSGLQQGLQSYLETVCMATDSVVLASGTSTPLPVAVLFLVQPGYDPNAVQTNINAVLNTVAGALQPGQSVAYSPLVAQLQAVTGVSSLEIATPMEDLSPDSDTEIFTLPSANYAYTVDLTNTGTFSYTGKLPFPPGQIWPLSITLNDTNLLLIPDTEPGYARIFGQYIVPFDTGYMANMPAASSVPGEYFLAIDTPPNGVLYESINGLWDSGPRAYNLVGKSRLNLNTGQFNLYCNTYVSSLSVTLLTSYGYNEVLPVNIYCSYNPSVADTPAFRQQLRATLRSVIAELPPGSSLFAGRQPGLNSSWASITDIIGSQPGIQAINRVSLQSPTNTNNRIDVSDLTRILAGQIVLNNSIN